VGWHRALPIVLGLVGVAGYLCARLAIARSVRFAPLTGLEGMTGGRAVAVTPLDPVGVIRYRGELWRAISSGPVPCGTPVQIVRVERQPEGFTAVVEATPSPAQP